MDDGGDDPVGVIGRDDNTGAELGGDDGTRDPLGRREVLFQPLCASDGAAARHAPKRMESLIFRDKIW